MEEIKVQLPAEINDLAVKVPHEKQLEVRKVLDSIFTGTEDWAKQVDAIEVKGIEDVLSIELADTARKNAKKARLDAEKIFDVKREEVQLRMQDDKLEDALWLKSKQIMQLKLRHIEEKAKFKADFVKRHEAEQLKLKIETRLLQIHKFNEGVFAHDIEGMSDDVFNNYLSGLEKNHNDAIEAEKKAELERIAKVKAEREEQERIKKENDQLKKDAEEKERLAKIERERIEKEREQERQKQAAILEKQRKDAEEKAKVEAQKQAKIEAELKEKVDTERRQKENIEAKFKEKQQAEQQAKEDKEKQLQAELSKGDADKIKDLINDLTDIKTKYQFKSANNQKKYIGVNELIDKVIGYIKN